MNPRFVITLELPRMLLFYVIFKLFLHMLISRPMTYRREAARPRDARFGRYPIRGRRR